MSLMFECSPTRPPQGRRMLALFLLGLTRHAFCRKDHALGPGLAKGPMAKEANGPMRHQTGKATLHKQNSEQSIGDLSFGVSIGTNKRLQPSNHNTLSTLRTTRRGRHCKGSAIPLKKRCKTAAYCAKGTAKVMECSTNVLNVDHKAPVQKIQKESRKGANGKYRSSDAQAHGTSPWAHGTRCESSNQLNDTVCAPKTERKEKSKCKAAISLSALKLPQGTEASSS